MHEKIKLSQSMNIDKINNLKKENELLLEWNREAQRQKLEWRHMYEELLKERSIDKENKQINKVVSCQNCVKLQSKVEDQQLLLEQCRKELKDIKRRMAEYAVFQKKELTDETDMKNAIITRLQKELLNARIELLKLQDGCEIKYTESTQLNHSKPFSLFNDSRY